MGSSLFGSFGSLGNRGSSLFDDIVEGGAADEKDLELSQRATYLRSLSPGFQRALQSPGSARPSHGPLRTAWDYASAPLKALAGVTGTLSAQLVRPFAPEAYESAAQELEQENAGYGPDITKPLENLPGLGDVAAQGISKEGVTGALVRPFARIGLNVLGDPTSYFGAGLLSRIPKVGRLASDLGQAQKAVEALTTAGRLEEAAELAPQVTRLAGMLSDATGAEGVVGRGARSLLEAGENLGRSGATGEALRSIATAPSFRDAVRGTGRLGATLPFSPLTGLAYAPELAESVSGQVGQTIENVRQGKYAEAAASGAGALLVAGLSRQVAKGLMSEAQAAGVLERSLARQMGDVPPPRVEEEFPTQPEPVDAPFATPPPREAPPATAQVPPEPTPEVPPGPILESPPLTQQQTQPALTEIPTSAAQPTVPPALTPIPGTERIKVDRSPDKVQALTDLIEARSTEGKPFTKRDLVSAGLVSEKQARTYNMEELLDSFGLTEARGRLELDPKSGGGYKVRPAEKPPAETPTDTQTPAPEPRLEETPEAPAVAAARVEARVEAPLEDPLEGISVHPDLASLEDQAVLGGRPPAEVHEGAPVPPPLPPTTSSPRTPRAEIDRQIAASRETGDAPDLGGLAENALRELAQSTKKPFDTLTADDVRAAFPGDDNKASRATLNRVLFAIQKRDRMVAKEAAEAAQAAQAEAEAAAAAGKGAGAAPKPAPADAAEGTRVPPSAPAVDSMKAAAETGQALAEDDLPRVRGPVQDDRIPPQEQATAVPAEPSVPQKAEKPSKPTPDRVLRIGRGAHGQVRVVFPDKLHADLFSAPGRSRKMIDGSPPGINPQWKHLAQNLGIPEKDIGDFARKYREQVQGAIKGLEEGADFEAPRAILEKPEKPVPAEPTPEMAAAARGLEGELAGGKPKPAKPAKITPIPDKPDAAAEPEKPSPPASTERKFADTFARYAGDAASAPAPKTAPRASPFERTLNRIQGLTPDQRDALSSAFEARQQHAGRADSVPFERLDPDLRSTLRLKTPEALADFQKRTGIKDPADWALLRTVVDTFDSEISRARDALSAAEKANAPNAEDLRGQLAFAGLRRAAVLDTLIPDFGKC